MSEEKEDNKSKRGFASCPENINKKGRPKNSKNRIPSDEDFKEALERHSVEAINKIVAIMRKTSNDATALKAAVKLADARYQLLLDEASGKLTITKQEKDKPKQGAKVLSLAK